MTLPEGLLDLENRPTGALRPQFPGRNKDVTDNGEDPSGKGSPASHNCLKFSGEVRGRPQIQPRPEPGSWSKELGLAPTRAAELEGTGVPRPPPLGAHTLRAHTVASRSPGQGPSAAASSAHTGAPWTRPAWSPGPAGSRSPKGAPDTSSRRQALRARGSGRTPRHTAGPGPGTRDTPGFPASGSRGGGVGWAGLPGERLPLPSKVPGTQVLGSGAGWTIAQSPQGVPGPRHPEATRAVTSAREASELHSPGLPAPSSGGRSAGPLCRARGSSEGGREGGSWAGGWPECTE